jgi:hypothetical protein
VTTAAPVPFTDEFGRPCCRVPLSNVPETFAIIDRHIYADLHAQGLTGHWLLNSNGSGRAYVRTAVPTEHNPKGTILLVARLIVVAGPGTVVRYANGDPLDLRFTNLAWRKGKSGRTDAAVLADAQRLRAERDARTMTPHEQPRATFEIT